MKCVVTGGCGFIGSHLVGRLLELGHQVAILDDLSTGTRSCRNAGAELIIGTVANLSATLAAFEDADLVFHTAAWARVERSVADPVGTHDINVTGTLNVLRAAHLSGVSKVINSSSSSVYGDQPTHLMREDMTPNPKSPYAMQKLMGEQYCELFSRLFGMSVASLRYFNVYGPGQPSGGQYALVIPKFLKMRKEGRALTVYGNGDQTRSYTHVSDAVEANILAATADLPAGQHVALNIGTGQETSVNEIAAAIGGPVQHIIPNPRREFEEARKAADYARAQSLIGWEPRIAFAEGIRCLLDQ